MQALNSEKPENATPRGQVKKAPPVRRFPLILLVVSLILFISGLNSGEPVSVWEKAVRICLSCIGIG